MDKRELSEFLRREQEISDLKAVMDVEEGRRFVWRMLGDAGVFRPSFVAGSPDTTAYNEGRRNLGLSLLGEIMAEASESFLIMQQEAMDHEHRRKEADSKAGSGGSDDGTAG